MVPWKLIAFQPTISESTTIHVLGCSRCTPSVNQQRSHVLWCILQRAFDIILESATIHVQGCYLRTQRVVIPCSMVLHMLRNIPNLRFFGGLYFFLFWFVFTYGLFTPGQNIYFEINLIMSHNSCINERCANPTNISR